MTLETFNPSFLAHGLRSRSEDSGIAQQERDNSTSSSLRGGVDLGRLMSHTVRRLPFVTVAGVHGACVGGGMVLAASCDFRVGTSACFFKLPEAVGSLVILPYVP